MIGELSGTDGKVLLITLFLIVPSWFCVCKTLKKFFFSRWLNIFEQSDWLIVSDSGTKLGILIVEFSGGFKTKTRHVGVFLCDSFGELWQRVLIFRLGRSKNLALVSHER